MNEFDAELKARAFVQRIGITTFPVELAKYLEPFSGKIVLDELEVDEAGYTMTVTGKGPLITLNANDRAARRRFTACHEVGHIVLELPSNHGYGPDWSYTKRPLNEVCCDVFAAELLLPYKLFIAEARARALDFTTVDHLRIAFFASREATASRLAATSKVACAYVLSEAGRVQHLVRSPALRVANAWVPRGTALPQESAAFCLRSGSDASGNGTYCGDAWFDGWGHVEMLESSIYIPEYDQTLTLLFCADQDDVDAIASHHREVRSESDDELLKPLDGQLPWPGKHRR